MTNYNIAPQNQSTPVNRKKMAETSESQDWLSFVKIRFRILLQIFFQNQPSSGWRSRTSRVELSLLSHHRAQQSNDGRKCQASGGKRKIATDQERRRRQSKTFLRGRNR